METRDEGLEHLEAAYSGFVDIVQGLPGDVFLQSLGDWTPRDIVAHLIGWNRNILTGCQQIRAGVSPFYHNDALNDYRIINAVSISRHKSTDRNVLLKDLALSKDELVAYIRRLAEEDWDKDYGPKHYRGGPATVGRSIASLAGDYLNHRDEIARKSSSGN